MQIEKINDNKFKCTLEKRDLDMRNLRLEELAYGTDKARQLFEEMLRKAHDQFGFTHEDAAISVEAYPISQDHLVLVISKVTNFDEIDTRFSRFSEREETTSDRDELTEGLEGFHPEEIEGESFAESSDFGDTSLKSASDQENDTPQESMTAAAAAAEPAHQPEEQLRVYAFTNLDVLLEVAQILHCHYNGVNDLFKDEESGTYYLVLKQTFHTDAEFGKTCNMLSEYGSCQANAQARYAYCKEHYHCMVEQTALQRLFLF